MSSRAITVIKLVEALLHYRHYTDRGPAALLSLDRSRPCCSVAIKRDYCHYTAIDPAAVQLQNVKSRTRRIRIGVGQGVGLFA